MGGAQGTYRRQERCIQGFSGKMRERGHLKYLGVDERIILKWILKKWNENAWTGLIWLRIGADCECLRVRQWTFRFHKMQGIS
jgi:hypothetical protein